MKIINIIQENKPRVSVELFPPKEWAQLEQTKTIVTQMAQLHPAFMSVTYGAGGGTSEHTVTIAKEVKAQNIPALAHLTCASSNEKKICEVLAQLKKNQIENILALRGDVPDGTILDAKFTHAYQLIEQIKTYGDFCVGGACYPEGHPESLSVDKDLDALKIKAESGCDFLTSQMFFDNNIFYAFRYRMLQKGIQIPVIAGIMPVTNSKQISRICQLSGTMLPPRFKAIVDRFGSDPDAMKQAGIAYATEQIIDLIANGVTQIHLYSMNKPEIAGSIMGNLSRIIHPVLKEEPQHA